MSALLRRVKNVANDRLTRVLFYDQTLKKGYVSLASFSKLFVLRRILVTLVAYPLSLVCWVFLVVLNRFTPVRIYRFQRPQRPGFASLYIEQLEPLCRELQDSGHKGFLIYIDASETTNLELLKLYATHFNLYLDDRVAFFRTIFSLIPRFGFSNTFVEHSLYSTNWELAPATFSDIKREQNKSEIISQFDLEPFKFVILTSRSISYDKKFKKTYSDLNRYSDVSKAAEAIKLIHEKGLKTVRMGVDTDELPESLKQLPIIDLSGKFRTDLQDLWLAENCLFLWGINNNGAWHFAHKYNRPTLVTDSYKFASGFQHSLFTFQLIWNEVENRYLSLLEMALLRGVNGRVSEMEKQGLRYVENSPSDLVSAVSEMLDCVDSKTDFTGADLAMLSEYRKALAKAGYRPILKNHSHPCISFLRENQNSIN